MNSLSFTLTFNVVADALCGGYAPREVVCICCDCANERDPHAEWSYHRAPDNSECLYCSGTDGFVYAVRPRKIAK